MKIDLEKFNQEVEEIVPIVNGWGRINSRRLDLRLEDGWYKLSLGNSVRVIKKASPLEVNRALKDKKKLMVYSLGDEGVPINFVNFKEHGFSESMHINFMFAQPFDVSEVVLWEDERFYFYGINQKYERELIKGVKEAFRQNIILPDLRGVTPEIRYAFMLGHLQRESYSKVTQILGGGKLGGLSGDNRRRIQQELKKDLGNVIRDSISKAGGTFVRLLKLSKDKYDVEWKVGGQTIKSIIKTDMRIVDAGFCLSGDDKKHSLNSIVNLAKDFQKDRPLYIERE